MKVIEKGFENDYQDDIEYDYRKRMPKREKKIKRHKHKFEVFKRQKENKL